MSKPKLVRLIRQEILKNGTIPFARFMELALYHPEYGYYTSAGEPIAWKGDFYTSSSVHPVFGELLAKQLMQMGEWLKTDLFTIVEVGAGTGALCHDILKYIQQAHPPFFDRCQYVIVEESVCRQEKQKSWLATRFPDHLSWSEHIPLGLTGVILSNELLDAFPVHRLVLDKNHVQEIHVDIQGDESDESSCCEEPFIEVLKPPSTPALTEHLRRLNLSFDHPYQLEINLRALDWIASAGQALLKGFVITIDYGYPAEELYHPKKTNGTFLCYHKHQTNEKPYEHIGEQDMTAHVDFTSIAARGLTAGLKTIGFTDQMHFLMGLGIAQRMETLAQQMFGSEKARHEFLAMKQLMDPNAMGCTFKVLIQAKGLPDNLKLDGLQFKAFDPLGA